MGESDLSDPEERYFIERLSTATRAGGRGSILTRDFDKKTARSPRSAVADRLQIWPGGLECPCQPTLRP